MAGGACISYTGSGPWNKNLNLNGKIKYYCNYNKLMNTCLRRRLTRYKILNREQAGNKYNLLKNQIKIWFGVSGTLSASYKSVYGRHLRYPHPPLIKVHIPFSPFTDWPDTSPIWPVIFLGPPDRITFKVIRPRSSGPAPPVTLSETHPGVPGFSRYTPRRLNGRQKTPSGPPGMDWLRRPPATPPGLPGRAI